MPVRPYEVVYIIDPDVNETDSAALVERFRALAEAQGATDLRVDTTTLGKRRLAYIINHKREGHYVVMQFQSEAKCPAEVERVLNITDRILRSLVVRLEVMPPEPEVIVAPPAVPVVEAVPEPVAPIAEVATEAVEAEVEPAVAETEEPVIEAAAEAAPAAEDAEPAAEAEAPAAE